MSLKKFERIKLMQLHFLYSFFICGLWLYTSNLSTLRLDNNTEVLSQKEAAESLSILTLNTWALPVKLSGHDQVKRFEMLPDELLRIDADIVCLQECFAQDLRKSLCRSLDNKYETLSDHKCYRRSMLLLLMDCYGGLMTFSKYPIVEELFFKFPLVGKSRIVERIGSKGFLVSTIAIDGKYIHVVNTHLYAGTDQKAKSHRERQLHYMNQVIDSIQGATGYDIVLTGDLNINHSAINDSYDNTAEANLYHKLIRDGHYNDAVSKVSESDYTMNISLNPYAHGVTKNCKIDYCLMKKADITASPYLMSSEVVFDRPDHIVSDHFGLLSIVYGIHTQEVFGSASDSEGRESMPYPVDIANE